VISTGMGAVLTLRWVAALLGFVLGAVIVTPVLLSVWFYDEKRPGDAWGMALGSIVLGLVIAVGVMFLYRSVAPVAFVTFGVAVVAGFFVAFIIGAVAIIRRQV
jgi:hypothetical protein